MIYIFDFDGVIKDSVDVKGHAFKELYKNDNVIAEKVYRDHMMNGGVPRLEKFRRWEELFFHRALSEERQSYLLQEYKRIVIDRVIRAPYIEGFLDFYQSISNELKYVCTASPQEEARFIIESLNLEFDEIFGFPRTKEEIITEIKSRAGDDAEFLYFGDSDKDLVACVNCDIPFVPINYSGKLLHIDRYSFEDING